MSRPNISVVLVNIEHGYYTGVLGDINESFSLNVENAKNFNTHGDLGSSKVIARLAGLEVLDKFYPDVTHLKIDEVLVMTK